MTPNIGVAIITYQSPEDAVRAAWKDRHLFNARKYAQRWLNLPAFGQAFIEAVAEACKRFGVTP
jgi:hypothetical protein